MENKQYDISDAFVDALQEYGIDKVFCVSGGSIHNLLAKVDSCIGIDLIPCYHEQGAIFAAEGYARAKNNVGVVLVTSGPGLTNIITGISCCWIDSIPLIVVAGQVVDEQKLDNLAVQPRQRGVQETYTHGLTKSITKKSISLKKDDDFGQVFDSLYKAATNRRQGPVLLEIPVNLTYRRCNKYVKEKSRTIKFKSERVEDADKIKKMLTIYQSANFPLLIVGNGIRGCDITVREAFFQYLLKEEIRYISTWGSKDLLEELSPSTNYLGSAGIFGSRAANAAMFITDCCLVLGCSFSYTQTGYRVTNLPLENYFLIDIDLNQLFRPEHSRATMLNLDLNELLPLLINYNTHYDNSFLKSYKKLTTLYDKHENKISKGSKVIEFYRLLNSYLEENSSQEIIVVTDMGTSFTSTHSYLNCKGNRLFTAGGHAPMGWGLPGAIGTCMSNEKIKCICISGDGGLLMNIQEIMHMKFYNLNMTLIILNNKGYATIENTTKRYHGRAIASTEENGIRNPSFQKIADAYSINYCLLDNFKNLGSALSQKGPTIIEIRLDSSNYIGSRLMANENEYTNMYPYLESNKFEQMKTILEELK